MPKFCASECVLTVLFHDGNVCSVWVEDEALTGGSEGEGERLHALHFSICMHTYSQTLGTLEVSSRCEHDTLINSIKVISYKNKRLEARKIN